MLTVHFGDLPQRTRRLVRGLLSAVLAALLTLTPACSPQAPSVDSVPADSAWRDFQGTWTAAGSRNVIRLGSDRQASVSNLSGSLMLAGPSRPGVGFRAEAVVLNDSATGMVGRAVWTDERGDQVYSELRGEGTSTGNRIVGTFLGGTGRYAGASGSFEFSWRFVLESEDGVVQGQSVGLKGRVRTQAPPAASPAPARP
jgi:hypothetical protein